MFSKGLFTLRRAWFFIIAIILLAAVLRFWQLGAIPEGFHSDEAAYGYNAYSLLKTGKDEYGKVFPLILRSFNDYKAAFYAYVTIPFMYVFGLHEWVVRLPSVMFGILFVLLTYALVYELSSDRRLATLSMLMAAISPIGIFLSRVQSDPLVCITLFFSGLYAWVRWTRTKNYWYIVLFISAIVLSFYTNTITRLFAVPFFLLYGAFYWRKFDGISRKVFAGLVGFTLVFVVALYFSSAGIRFSQINVFSTDIVSLSLTQDYREDGAQKVPLVVTRLLHNKVTAYGTYLVQTYTDYFSFQFLFLQASQPLREQVPNAGILFLIDCPFLLIGIYTAIRKKLPYGVLALLWLLLVPVVLSPLSDETPNIHRFFLAMIPIHLLVALGVITAYEFVSTSRRKFYLYIVGILYVLSLFSYLHQLFVHQPIHAPIYRNAAEKKLALTLKNLYSSYDVIVNQKILEQILFYWPVDPATYQKEGSPRDTDNATYGKFLFVTDACPSRNLNPAVRALTAKKVLYVDKPECAEVGNKIVGVIKYHDTLDAYYLVEAGAAQK